MIKIHCKYDELLDPKKLKNHPKNRNKHGQDQIERLSELYKYHGIRHPIIVSNLSKCIVAGHGRKLAAIRAGLKEMPVVYQDFDSSEAEYAFIQADNAIALWAELDLSGINSDLADLGPDFDINMLGIQDFTLDVADKFEDKDADEVPEEVEPQAKLGHIYQLGDHRLMCGDSTDDATVSLLMNGEKADMVFTDPPYGVDYSSQKSTMFYGNGRKGKPRKQILGDKNTDIYSGIMPIIRVFNSGPCYIFCGAGKELDTLSCFIENEIEIVNTMVWDKQRFGGQAIGANYKPCFELFYYVLPKNNKRKWNGPNNEETIWRLKRDNKTELHPTQKPVELSERAIKNHDAPNVLDLFGGSGSTLIACEKTNRKCFMMELDPHYVDVIIARWEKFTGKKSELLNG